MQSLARDLLGDLREPGVKPGLVTVLELVGTSLEHERFRAAATTVATELSSRLDLERVTIGFVHRGHMRVEALSHSARFDQRANLIRDLGLAMDEASDQDTTIVHPRPAGIGTILVRAHEQLVRQHGSGSICTVPIALEGRIVGAFSFERRIGEAFDAATVKLCEDVVALVGPILELKRAADARFVDRLREGARARLLRIFGTEQAALRALGVAGVLLLLLLTFAKATYRVTAEATLEGRVQRVIVAGVDGFIAEANVRAGDLVREGQVLGQLDERDLQLEQRKWSARRDQLRREYREALAGHDRSQVNIVSAQLAQAEAQLELLSDELGRTRLVAPFDGVVVKGDLSQALGSPVTKGDVLFEVAPLDGYRVILEVDDRDIVDVHEGERGKLALSALPGRSLPFIVERVTPVSVAEDGRNYFRVEARLDEPADSLRPGMEGIAKIEAGRRRLLWIFSHQIVDWVRLRLWSWLP